MTLPRFLLIAAASWSILAAIGTTTICALVTRYRRKSGVEYDRITVMTELPPVPQSDATWLDPWPSGAHLIDVDAVHGLLSEEQVFPTADEAEQRVYDKLLANIEANFRVLGDAA